jgi:hypothetical protein
MAWRIRYWHGNSLIREQTIARATREEVATMLEQLASKRFELDDSQRASEVDSPNLRIEDTGVRSNRAGTILWTTGKDFHYTAEWLLPR